MNTAETSRHPKGLELERSCVPNREAMLAAFRVVLDLPRKSFTLKEKENDRLALLAEESDVCTLTARTQFERIERGHEGASGQEERQ